MYKTLYSVVVLLALVVMSAAQSTVTAPPRVVAKAKLTNQTAPIPKTTIFTPSETGLYRLSVYGTITKVDPNSVSAWVVEVFWNDDSGALTTGLIIGYGNTSGPFLNYAYLYPLGGFSVVLEATAHGQISFDVGQAVPDNSAYSLYYTLEKVE